MPLSVRTKSLSPVMLANVGPAPSFGPSWESTRPVAFESHSLKSMELHYPTHEQELLSIIHSLQKWWLDLLEMHFTIYTDHKTLQNFDSQKDLSMRQMQWMEYLSQYDYTIQYINGEANCVMDTLSCYSECIILNNPPLALALVSILEINGDVFFLNDICTRYTHDAWCSHLIKELTNHKLDHKLNIFFHDSLLFTKHQLIIPCFNGLQEQIFWLTHDNLSHFGEDKTYEHLCHNFYWPHMWWDLIQGYIPSCTECQHNKSWTMKPAGSLHPLAILDGCFRSVAMDFIRPLPVDNGFDCILTLMDHLGADIQIILCRTDMGAEEIAGLFFNCWYCENGCSNEIISDQDKIFMSKFWVSVMCLSGIKHKMSMAYHPQTDGSSEQTNKTVIQCICFHVDRQQRGWSKVL